MIRRLLLFLASAGALAGCGPAGTPDHLAIPGADAARGHALTLAYGCGACHVIPGVGGAIGRAGPPLEGWSARTLVAGLRPNTPENLVAWLLDPVAIQPDTGMPAMGLDGSQARDVAAFLYTLDSAAARVRPPATGLDPSRVPEPLALPGRGPFVDTRR